MRTSMKTRRYALAVGMTLGALGAAHARAGQASTSAWADGNRYGPGTAGATAQYDGNGGIGLARTHTDTGAINLARGLAVGYDGDGLDVSFSHAIAPNHGPAYAGTFNLSIGNDGQVSGSYGGVLATGGSQRSVEAGGATASGPRAGGATAMATGHASPGGHVKAYTKSYDQPGRTHASAEPVRQPRRVTKVASLGTGRIQLVRRHR